MELILYGETDKIFYIDVVDKELKGLFKKERFNKQVYEDWLDLHLKKLDRTDLSILLNDPTRPIEKLSGGKDNLYALRYLKGAINVRVIFSSVELPDSDIIYILLIAFKENNKRDYTNAISTAQKRMKVIPQLIKDALM